MKKRFVLTLMLLLLVASVPLFAQFGARNSRLGFAFGIPNGALVYRPSPFDIKFGYDFTEGQEFVFLSGDVRLIDNRPLVGVLHGSFGFGLFGKVYPQGHDGDDVEFEGGARIPFALSVLLLDDFLEFFVELAPGIDLYPKAQFSEDQPLQLFAGFTVELDF